MLEIIKSIGLIASAIVTVSTCLTILIKPVRNKLFGLGLIKEGLKCLLRNEITRIYYKNLSISSLRQYEYENLCRLYTAYKMLNGNSFVDRIFAEMRDVWKVVD